MSNGIYGDIGRFSPEIYDLIMAGGFSDSILPVFDPSLSLSLALSPNLVLKIQNAHMQLSRTDGIQERTDAMGMQKKDHSGFDGIRYN